ncbi:MAG TPA: SufD family Fe-S cluster assembly protein, partial [Thermodesulfobacteriota bacterium]|nr:SufD family Fe-S cluster assembly protein [Thermodesulfobacteriota bacterium]
MRDLDGKALQAKDKKALYGPDVDLQSFKIDASPHAYLTDLRALSQEDRDHIIQAGIDTGEQERSGTFIQKDTSVIHAHSRVEGLEIIPIKQALETYDWVQEYYWKLASVDTDKFTAQAHLNLHDGYVIRALPGAKVVYPVQACLYIGKEGLNQNVHNLIIAEEDSELHMITGCQTARHVKSGLHV